MKRAGLIILIGGVSLTGLLVLCWILGFIFAGAAVGNLIHLLLVFAVLTGMATVVGLVLFLIGRATQKKN